MHIVHHNPTNLAVTWTNMYILLRYYKNYNYTAITSGKLECVTLYFIIICKLLYVWMHAWCVFLFNIITYLPSNIIVICFSHM